jgi:SAM-dependent methyltransferase
VRFSWAFRYRLIREGIYRSIRDLRPEAAGRVLDIGCGHKPYRELFPGSDYVGIDMPFSYGEGSSPDAWASAEGLPFKDGAFDCVVCTEVLEHLEGPARAVMETARVLRPGGCLLLSAPFMWPVHERPRDFFRFTRYGLESLLAAGGLEVTASVQRGGFWSVMVQLASDHWHPRGRRGRLAAAVADRLWAPPQWAAGKLDKWRTDPDYSLGWTVKAVKRPGGMKPARWPGRAN